MNPREAAFWRKIIYLVVIALLLGVMYYISRPATGDAEGGRRSSGGLLAQLRYEHGLSQAHLGQIDATSETIRWTTLGLRGVASNILWQKARDYKKKKDWTNLGATVNQITMLQPNFIHVWVFQGWNLSYNVSAEFDDYRERYRWVKKGIHFLEDGMIPNEREPRLPWETGWIVSQKIGRSDEHKQFRRMFKRDDDFHDALRKRGIHVPGRDPRDNWLVGKQWYRAAERLVDELHVEVTGNLLEGRPESVVGTTGTKLGKSPLIFRSSAPMCQMNYAEARGDDGHFGEVTQFAWKAADDEWVEYGWVDIPTAYEDAAGNPVIINLNSLDRRENYQQQVEQLIEDLDALEPGLRERLEKERRDKLTPEQREALDTPIMERTGNQQALADKASELVEVTHEDVARAVTGDQRPKAIEIFKKLADAQDMATYIRRYRDIVNFGYWRDRAEVEQTEEALAAREFIYNGTQDMEQSKLQPAKENFKKGLEQWRNLLDKEEFKHLAADERFGPDVMDVVKLYRRLLRLRDEKEELDETYGPDFILHDVVEMHDEEQ